MPTRTLLLSTSAIVMSATSLLAGDPSGWQGAYIGAGIGLGNISTTNNTSNDPSLSAGAEGEIFGGYNHAFGQFLLGGEIAYRYRNADGITNSREYTSDSVTDFKFKIGGGTEKLLAYGLLGYSMTDIAIDGADNGGYTGMSFGFGGNYMVTDRIFVGAEAIYRSMSGDSLAVKKKKNNNSGTVNEGSVSVRAGFLF